jgi:hypothetical protein
MKLYVRNTLSGLMPLYPADYDEKRKLKLGEDYEVTIRRPRNIRFHRLFFALVAIGHENTSLDMPIDAYRRYVTMKAGYYRTYTTPKGVFVDAESISFSSMDEDTFRGVYDRVLDVIINDIQATREDIETMLAGFI